jgi:RNA-directed DNA polymerase
MPSEGKLGNLGEPPVSLSLLPEEEGYRLTKSPGARGALPIPCEPEGTQTEGADRVLGSERTRSDPRGTVGSLSGAQYRGRWGSEAQATHWREGDAGHTVRLGGQMGDTSRSPTITTQLQRIAEQAKKYPEMVFTTLAHLMDVDFLREAYQRTRKDSAPGIDGVTAAMYAEHLEENLRDLHERLRSGRYQAPPVKRHWLAKADGSQRPIGLPTFEDKIVQRAVTMLLGAIYEEDFHEFSHGFRSGPSAHQALSALREQCREQRINWIVDADVSGFFDNLGHDLLQEMLQQRVKDGSILRLIGKWLHAGVLDGETLLQLDTGSPQGAVISPLLGNVFLHQVLDEWYVHMAKPRLRGRSFLVRYGDDFVLGCELEADARRLMAVLPKRFARFGLTIHPQKTTLVAFGKPSAQAEGTQGKSTFEFLGFTHYWARSRQGYWVIKRRTAKKRLRRTLTVLWQWCRSHRHRKVEEQHQELCQKLRGHYQYYGIRGNYRLMEVVLRHAENAWRYWLSRRSQKGMITGNKLERWREQFPLPTPKIVHNI